MVGILADDGTQSPAIEQIILAFTQMQDDLRATVCFLYRLKCIISFTTGFPTDTMFGSQCRHDA